MTPQEIFDTSVSRLLKQGRGAYDISAQSCRYRTDDGLMCAVGILFNEEEMEACADIFGSASYLVSYGKRVNLRPFFEEHMDLLSVMQWAHDSASYDIINGTGVPTDTGVFRDRLKKAMFSIAKRHGLNTGVLQ